MYNNIGDGGYFTYRWYPERQVFWDGRLLVFEDLFRRLSDGESITDIHRIDWASDLHAQSGENPYVTELWAIVNFDRQRMVYIARDGAASDLIDEHEYFMLGPYYPEETLRNIRDYRQEVKDRVVIELERFLMENQSDYARAYVSGAYIMLGDEYMNRAADLLSTGLESNRYYADYWHYSALYDLETGNYDRAERTINSLLFWWPRATPSRFLLARIYAAQNEHSRAIRLIRQVISDGYEYAVAYHVLAFELAAEGIESEAVSALEEYFTRVFPQDYETREYADAVELARQLIDE